VAGREGERGECQTGLGVVWREIGAVRSARPSRSQAASTWNRRSGEGDAKLPRLSLEEKLFEC
jgi:hypothetical protein